MPLVHVSIYGNSQSRWNVNTGPKFVMLPLCCLHNLQTGCLGVKSALPMWFEWTAKCLITIELYIKLRHFTWKSKFEWGKGFLFEKWATVCSPSEEITWSWEGLPSWYQRRKQAPHLHSVSTGPPALLASRMRISYLVLEPTARQDGKWKSDLWQGAVLLPRGKSYFQ